MLVMILEGHKEVMRIVAVYREKLGIMWSIITNIMALFTKVEF